MVINNPWNALESGKMKRVNSQCFFDIYWLKELNGNYSLYFKIKNIFKNFKNIETKELKTKFSDDWLVITLNDTSNWEIFYVFCNDLILITEDIKDKNLISSNLYNRILEWKELLQGKYKKQLSLEEQMGLFSELITLKDFILFSNRSVTTWRGPEKDSQDFLCDNCAIEVKSSLSSRNKIATISSKHQLETEKNNLFIVFYSLTKTDNGLNLTELVNNIIKMIENEEDKNYFLKNLLENGYDFEEENYFAFIIDSQDNFNVNAEFPKLNSRDIDNKIIEVKYKIDLKLCDDFKIKKEEIMEAL